MSWFKNLKTLVKLLLSFALVCIIMGVVGYMSVATMQSIQQTRDDTFDNAQSMALLGKAVELLKDQGLLTRAHILAESTEERSEHEEGIAQAERDMLGAINEFRKTVLSDEDKALLTDFDKRWPEFVQVRDQAIDLSKSGYSREAVNALNNGSAQADAVAATLKRLVSSNEKEAVVENEEAAALFDNSLRAIIVVLAVGILIAIGLGTLVALLISTPLKQMAQVADGLAEGDIEQEITVSSKDEIGDLGTAFQNLIAYNREMAGVAGSIAQGDLTKDVTAKSVKDVLGKAFSDMIQNLRTQVSQVAQSAISVKDASEQLSTAATQAGTATQQIATTIQQVAKGNQEQSASVNDTVGSFQQLGQAIEQIATGAQDQAKAVGRSSATVTQMSAGVQQVAGNSQTVAKAAAEAQEAVRAGAGAVEKTVAGMRSIQQTMSASAVKVKELGQHSKQIGSIVEAIDDIAEQTNLLALNAAIEAARAGQHGKGFAVVADEVRKLAERSRRATKEIAALISTVQTGTAEAVKAMEQGSGEVESGVVLAEDAGKALQSILTAVELTHEQVEQIASATQQMNSASNEVVKAMDEVARIAEGNSAATEEMAAGSGQVSRAMEQIAAISEENSAAAEEVSATTEEMSAQVEEVVASSQELAQMAQQLQEVVAHFKLSEGQLQAEVTYLRRKDDWAPAKGKQEAGKQHRLASAG